MAASREELESRYQAAFYVDERATLRQALREEDTPDRRARLANYERLADEAYDTYLRTLELLAEGRSPREAGGETLARWAAEKDFKVAQMKEKIWNHRTGTGERARFLDDP